MPRSTPRPLWGWTTPARIWLAVFGGIAALGLIAGSWTPDGPPPPPPFLVVDPNTAPPEVLEALPRLGPVLVGRIVAARNEAPFRSLDDFDARVKGIGPATIAVLRPHLRLDGERPGPGRGASAPVAAANPAPPRTRVARSP